MKVPCMHQITVRVTSSRTYVCADWLRKAYERGTEHAVLLTFFNVITTGNISSCNKKLSACSYTVLLNNIALPIHD